MFGSMIIGSGVECPDASTGSIRDRSLFTMGLGPEVNWSGKEYFQVGKGYSTIIQKNNIIQFKSCSDG